MSWHVCPDCKGEKYKSKLGAFTSGDLDEWYGEGDSVEKDGFIQEYKKRGGAYDEPCSFCKGNGLVDDEKLAEWEDELQFRYEQRMGY